LDAADGEIYDTLGGVTGGGNPLAELDDLLLVVGEWIACMAAREGPLAYQLIHPDLRQQLFQLVPGGVAISDEDELDLISRPV
jgi:hypothetical protein